MVILAVIIIAALSFYIYAKGAFGYPYLEDEDPCTTQLGQNMLP